MDVPAVQPGHLARDRQTQPGARGGLHRVVRGPVEFLEDALVLGRVPMPVSRTLTATRCSLAVSVTCTVPFSGVYLIALPIKFISSTDRRCLSPRTLGVLGGSVSVKSMRFSSAAPRLSCTICRISRTRSTSPTSRRAVPTSSCDKLRMSSTSDDSRRVSLMMTL